MITVSDNGVGIPSDMLPRVFDLFTQVRDNIHRSHGGLGIGLALVKQLVEMHGGAIVAESAGPGKGSSFQLRLRVAEPAPAASGAAEPSWPVSPEEDAALKVLVVDDNFDVAQTVGWMIEAIGHEYRLVHEGKLAVQSAREYRPDAIMLDINMPGMDGYAVCRALRSQTLFNDTVIIAQTGWGQAQARTGAGESGFDRHLVKLVNMDRTRTIAGRYPIRAAKQPRRHLKWKSTLWSGAAVSGSTPLSRLRVVRGKPLTMSRTSVRSKGQAPRGCRNNTRPDWFFIPALFALFGIGRHGQHSRGGGFANEATSKPTGNWLRRSVPMGCKLRERRHRRVVHQR